MYIEIDRFNCSIKNILQTNKLKQCFLRSLSCNKSPHYWPLDSFVVGLHFFTLSWRDELEIFAWKNAKESVRRRGWNRRAEYPSNVNANLRWKNRVGRGIEWNAREKGKDRYFMMIEMMIIIIIMMKPFKLVI